MEIHNKRKLLRAPPNLTLGVKKDQQFAKNGVSSCNLSRIVDRTQRTQFKQEESILNDFGVLLNTRRQDDRSDDQSNHDNNISNFNNQEEKNNLANFYDPKQDNHNIEVQKMYEEYQKALEILTNQTQVKVSPVYSFFKAYQILSSLIEIIKSQKIKDFKYQLAENIALNYWKVGNDLFFASQHIDSSGQNIKGKSKKQSLTQQKEKQKILQNFKQVFPILQEIVQRQNIKINKLTILSLILSKQYFRQKDMGKALEWCEKGFAYCPKFKNTSILLKLHYMKSKIYNQIHANQPQYEQVKKCIFFLKTLSQNTTQNKQFSHQFMRTLIKRRDELKSIVQGTNQGYKFFYNKSTQKNTSNVSGMNKSGSLTKFRKRSISLSKLKVLNDDQQFNTKPNQNNMIKVDLKKSLHKDMVNNLSAFNQLNKQTQKDFLKLDINRKTKLKKKGQTLTIWQKNSQKISFQHKIAKELEKASTSIKQDQNSNNNLFRNLMLRRPNDKRAEEQENTSSQQKDIFLLNDKLEVIKPVDRIRSDSKQKNHSKNLLSSSSSHVPGSKLQSNKDQQPTPTQYEQQGPKQDTSTTNNLKNKVVIISKSDNQLMKFISQIQNQFLGRYFNKSSKMLNNQNLQDLQAELLNQKDDFAHENDLISQFLNKDSGGRDQNNFSKLRAKNTFEDYDNNAIQEDSNDSENSYTRNFVFPEENNQERLIFSNMLSSKHRKSSAITSYGIIDDISLEVKKIKVSSLGKKQKLQSEQNTSQGFRFVVCLTISNEKLQVQLEFPLQKSMTNSKQVQNEDQKFDVRFKLWIYESIHDQTNRANQAKDCLDEGDLIKSMIRRQSIDLDLDSFLIEKIVTNLELRRNNNIGYTIITQREASQKKQESEEWQRENIFQWREKNFQYLKESSLHNLLSVGWKQRTKSKKNQNACKKNVSQLQEGIKSIKTFFIELQKISPSNSNNKKEISSLKNTSDIIYMMNRYNIDNSESFDKQFVNSYVLYNQKAKVQKLELLESEVRNLQEGQSFVNISGVSDEQGMMPLNFSQNIDRNLLIYDDQAIQRIQYMREASMTITNSFFPKAKYIQLVQRYLTQSLEQQQTSSPFTKQRNLLNSKQIQIQSQQTNRNINQFIIRIIGLQPTEAYPRKKGSVRKSQIIQLQQNLNYNNFIKEVFKKKSSFQNQQKQKQHYETSNKRSQFTFVKTMEKVSSDGKWSMMGVNAETSERFDMTKSCNNKRKSQDDNKIVKSQISKSTMVKILKKALIQPDYKKSSILTTYFDSLSIKSFHKVMGSHPNYIKLTCFRLKSIYIQQQQNMSYYYLFQLQQRQARTRMHKFIIGDRQIIKLLNNSSNYSNSRSHEQNNVRWMSELSDDNNNNNNGLKNDNSNNQKENSSSSNLMIVRRAMRQTKTLPQKKKVEITIQSHNTHNNNNNDQVLSNQNKNNHYYLQSVVTSSKLKTKRSIFQSQHQNFTKKRNLPESIAIITPLQQQFQPKFSQQSLTQVMKMITPHIIIKKDYIYTSVCLKFSDPLFFMMNKFTVENDQITSVEEGNQKKCRTMTSCGQMSVKHLETSQNISELSRTQTLKPPKTQQQFQQNRLLPNNKKDKNYFLTEEIKSKKILCQKSIVLEISQNFLNTLKQNQNKQKHQGQFNQQNQNKKNLNKLSSKESSKPSSKQSPNKLLTRRQQSLFAILTIIKISKSNYFTIKLYIPKFQRSYTLTLDKSLLNYLQMKDFQHIFGEVQEATKILSQLENQQLSKEINRQANKYDLKQEDNYLCGYETIQSRRKMLVERLSEMLFQDDMNSQKIYWKNLLSLIKIEEKYSDDKVYLIMKISNFHGFIKDCSFLQYFEKNAKIYMIEMTISKKSPNCQYFPNEDFIESLQGNKIRRGLLTGKQGKVKFKEMRKKSHKNKEMHLKNAKQEKLIDAGSINCHNQQFLKMSSIYESKTEGYTLYVQIFKIYDETQSKKQSRLTEKNSLSHRFGKTTEIDEDEIGSQNLGVNESINQINLDIPNMSERGSEVSFSDFRSNSKLIRTNTFRNTLKSTAKSIVQNMSKNQGSQQMLPSMKRFKLNFKTVNTQIKKSSSSEPNQISKINFSFYLCELNSLFKYIDENYSEEFNEEFFVLAQMSTAFKMLGTMIIEEFKSVREKNQEKSEEKIPQRSNQHKTTILKHRNDQQLSQEKGFKFNKKRSVMRNESNQFSAVDSLIQRQQPAVVEGITHNPKKEKQLQNKDSPIKQQNLNQQQQQQQQISKKTRNRHKYSVEQLFGHYSNQKYFKEKILCKIKQFKQKLNTTTQSQTQEQNCVKQNNQSNQQQRQRQRQQHSQSEISRLKDSKHPFTIQQQSPQQQNKEKFISLHSKFSNSLLIDLHVLSSEKQHKLSSLFYQYGSLLFLISNTKTFEIYTISVKVEKKHPFAFIQILEGKKELKCIKNRLFKFYRNLLLLMAK